MDLKDKKIEKNKYFIDALFFAFEGIKTVIKEERNMRVHLTMALGTIILSFYLNVSKLEWLVLIIVIFLVLLTEIMNTLFENVVDMITHHHYHAIGKKVKDMAAGCVLLSSLLAIIVGLIIFIPKMYLLIKK